MSSLHHPSSASSTTTPPPPPPSPPPDFDEFQRQTSLMTSCTLLWKELSDHFTFLEQNLKKKSDDLQQKLQSFDNSTKTHFDLLEKRDATINNSIDFALKRVDLIKKKSFLMISQRKLGNNEGDNEDFDEIGDKNNGFLIKLRSFCLGMDYKGLWNFVSLRKKMIELLRFEMPKALEECLDPPRIVIEAISDVFPVDKRERGNDLGWACVLLLESLVPVICDSVLGKERVLVSPSIKEKAKAIAETWKRSFEERGGIENVKTPDVHTFLQHLVTFGIVEKDDVGLYRKLVVGSAWRKQMPKLAVSLGLGDDMPGMIDELISRGQQVDAVHFTYEVGLVDKFPPVPLLKDFLNDAKKAASSISEDPNNSGRAALLAAKKEQSALRAVIKCIEEYQLEAEFPPENLKKRLELLEKTKTDKRKEAEAPANKRMRASNGGPMPPAKAGRSTNAYVSSFPTPPTYVMSPSHSQYLASVLPYPPSPAMYGPGSRSPSYTYSPEAASPPYVGSYSTPMNYPIYGGYCSGIAPAYQQAYY
ncbi:hypothetical protein LIER_32955 [Lithospermum erythrorhizon]|uniref:FRIGIDA-like protein n=1 Tax=Lithospermum erythrorhizon TaxID=34254 RepID=A0AAV3RZ76_LITER